MHTVFGYKFTIDSTVQCPHATPCQYHIRLFSVNSINHGLEAMVFIVQCILALYAFVIAGHYSLTIFWSNLTSL